MSKTPEHACCLGAGEPGNLVKQLVDERDVGAGPPTVGALWDRHDEPFEFCAQEKELPQTDGGIISPASAQPAALLQRDRAQEKELPQPQVRWALGLLMENPVSWRPSL